MIPPMMNFERTLPKHFLTKILHTKSILMSNFEAIIHQQIPNVTAQHHLSGPLNIDHLDPSTVII